MPSKYQELSLVLFQGDLNLRFASEFKAGHGERTKPSPWECQSANSTAVTMPNIAHMARRNFMLESEVEIK